MPRQYEELTGEFEYIKRKYPASDGQIKILPGILADGTQVVGYCGEDELECGLTYLFRGFWSETQWGKQFVFYSFGISQPVGQRGTVSYLTRGPGIGRKRAMQIWEKYGQDALEVVRERPKEVAAAIAGLTEAKATEAAAYFQAHKDREIVTRDLEELLSGGGFPKKLIDKLIEKFGAKATEKIKANPWLLMRFSGVGYGRADKLYLRLGNRPDTVDRMGWCCWNALHKDRDGSTWRPIEFGRVAITKGVAGMDVKPQEGIDWAIAQRHIAVRKNGDGRTWISEQERAGAERRLASQVHRAMVEGTT